MLEINPLIMAVTFVVFIGMLYWLNQKLYQPLLKFMDDRDATVNRGMREAENLSGNTRDLEHETAATIDAAKNTAAQQRQTALEALQAEQAAALAVRQGALAQEFARFKASLEEERTALQDTLLSELPHIKESLRAKFG